MSMRFLTPNTNELNGVSVRRFFCVDTGLAHFLTGCLDQLTHDYNWEQFGDATQEQIVELFEEVLGSMGNCESVGQIIATVGDVPSFCLLMDGSIVAVDDFPLLAASVPQWVTGTSIQLPDMRSAYLVGDDAYPSQFVGSNEHTLTVEEMPAHTHEYTMAAGSVTTVVVPDEPSAVPAPAISSPTGGNLPHNNMPKSLPVKWAVVAW